MTRSVVIAILLIVGCYSTAQAGVKSKAAREAAGYLIERFGKEVGEESVETLAERIGKYGARYGDDAIDAIRKAGPRAFKLLDDAGENAPDVVKLLNRYGNDAIWVASKPRSLAIFVKYGDGAAEAMIKHPGVAEPIIERFGQPAARAMQSVSSQNARRIAMMADDGALKAIGKTDELLAVVGKYGDGAMDFIWRNKGALAVGATLTAFLANPQPFIDGTVDLSTSGIEAVAKPVATGIANNTNWTVILLVVTAVASLFVGMRLWLRHRPMPGMTGTNTRRWARLPKRRSPSREFKRVGKPRVAVSLSRSGLTNGRNRPNSE
jgi:hypothetical protein